MGSPTTVKTRIGEILINLSEIESANVHTRNRAPEGYTWANFDTHLRDSGDVVDAWFIEGPFDASMGPDQSGAYSGLFRITGLRAFSDSGNTQGDLESLLYASDKIASAITQDPQLEGTTGTRSAITHTIPRLVVQDFQEYTNAVVHRVVIEMRVRWEKG